MMNDIFAALLLLAAVWGVASGNSAEVSSAMLKSGIGTAELMLTVAGGMVMWSGCGSLCRDWKKGATRKNTSA